MFVVFHGSFARLLIGDGVWDRRTRSMVGDLMRFWRRVGREGEGLGGSIVVVGCVALVGVKLVFEGTFWVVFEGEEEEKQMGCG